MLSYFSDLRYREVIDIHTGFQCSGGEGVAQGMEVDIRNPGFTQSSFEQILIGPGLIHNTKRCGEYWGSGS